MRNATILMTSLLVSIAATLAFAEDAPAEKASKEFFDASGGRAPFSGAVRVGDTLYMSGALGTKDRKLAEGGTGPETVQALENIKARLSMRDFMETLRNSGVDTGGPSALNHRDREKFANCLDKLLLYVYNLFQYS